MPSCCQSTVKHCPRFVIEASGFDIRTHRETRPNQTDVKFAHRNIDVEQLTLYELLFPILYRPRLAEVDNGENAWQRRGT